MDRVRENLIPIGCIVVACVLCALGRDGWGWFLFAAVLFYVG